MVPKVEPQEYPLVSLRDHFRPKFAIREFLLGMKTGFWFVATHSFIMLMVTASFSISPDLVSFATKPRDYVTPLFLVVHLKRILLVDLPPLPLAVQIFMRVAIGTPILEEISYRGLGWLYLYFLAGLSLRITSFVVSRGGVLGLLFYGTAATLTLIDADHAPFF